jgi:succinate dehydrogenase / fumarate reductase membrane anchor subunit
MRSAASGFRAWLVQRVSAVVTLAFVGLLGLHFLINPPRSYEAWRAWALSPAVSLAGCVFFAALLMHAWVGLRDVVMDYVHAAARRVATLALVALLLTGLGAWVLRILMGAPHA